MGDPTPALLRKTAAQAEKLAKRFSRGSVVDRVLRDAAQQLYGEALYIEQSFPRSFTRLTRHKNRLIDKLSKERK